MTSLENKARQLITAVAHDASELEKRIGEIRTMLGVSTNVPKVEGSSRLLDDEVVALERELVSWRKIVRTNIVELKGTGESIKTQLERPDLAAGLRPGPQLEQVLKKIEIEETKLDKLLKELRNPIYFLKELKLEPDTFLIFRQRLYSHSIYTVSTHGLTFAPDGEEELKLIVDTSVAVVEDDGRDDPEYLGELDRAFNEVPEKAAEKTKESGLRRITRKIFQGALDAFCPRYPFC